MNHSTFRLFVFALLVIIPSVVSTNLHAQTPAIQKLKRALQTSRDDNEKADLAAKIAVLLFSHNLADGLAYAKQSLEFAGRDDYKMGMAQALTTSGTGYFYMGDMTTAIRLYRQAIGVMNDQQAGSYPAITYLRMGMVYRTLARFDSAQAYNEKAMRLIDSKKDTPALALLLRNQGLLANAYARNEEAVRLLKTSAVISRALGDSAVTADTWRLIGSVFKDWSSYDSSAYFFDKAQRIADKLNNPVLRMLLSLNRGETNFSVGEFDLAIENYSTALNLLKDHNYKFYYAIALFKIGEVYENEGAYNTAYEYFYNALHEFEKMGARQEIQRTYSQIGWCYAYQENYTEALENAKNSLSIAEEIRDSSSIGQNQNLLGYILYKTRRYNEALAYFNDATTIRRKIQDWYGYSFSLYNLALTHLELHNLKTAHDLFRESLAVDKRTGKKIGLLFTSNTMGLQYAKERNFKEAARYLAEANLLARDIPVPTQLLANYRNYIALYEAQNNSAKVISYYKLYTALKDSLSNEVSSSRIAKADALFQLQKKANELQLINQENELHQEMIGVQQKEITFQRLVIGLAIFSLLALGAFTVTVYRLFQSNKRSKEQFRKQNLEIIEQQEEIQAQSEELKESNQKLYGLNSTLIDKNEEIEIQTEKLKTAFDTLESINNSLEKRVDERTRELNNAYQELETFFYHTSHDFRRPLSTYLGLAELAKTTLKDPTALELFDKVKQTTIDFDNMLGKLQSIGNVHYHDAVRNTDIKAILNACLEKFHSEIRECQITVSLQVDIERVHTNSFLLTIAAENLIENAIHFCCTNAPLLDIRATSKNDTIDITFRDNGQGIDDRLKPRIFEMYFRASTASKGNGLGLYIARRAIEKSGGTLSFTSHLGEGSCFTIHLPRDRR